MKDEGRGGQDHHLDNFLLQQAEKERGVRERGERGVRSISIEEISREDFSTRRPG